MNLNRLLDYKTFKQCVIEHNRLADKFYARKIQLIVSKHNAIIQGQVEDTNYLLIISKMEYTAQGFDSLDEMYEYIKNHQSVKKAGMISFKPGPMVREEV